VPVVLGRLQRGPLAACIGVQATNKGGHVALHTAPTVLVVEDDELLREMFVVALQPAGYHLVQAESGLEAVRAIEQAPAPAVMVLDLMLPDMDGLQVLR
jgi:CheY-like chemotaxis protein